MTLHLEMMFAAGTLLGTYEITGLLGSGGMGEVYRGRDTRLDRPVALKVLPAALAADPRFRQRFDREARVISRLNHPQICTVYDIGDAQGVSFLVMELVEGETLRAWGSRPRARTISDIVAIVLQISRARGRPHGRDRPSRHQTRQRPRQSRRDCEGARLRRRQAGAGGGGRGRHHRFRGDRVR